MERSIAIDGEKSPSIVSMEGVGLGVLSLAEFEFGSESEFVLESEFVFKIFQSTHIFTNIAIGHISFTPTVLSAPHQCNAPGPY